MLDLSENSKEAATKLRNLSNREKNEILQAWGQDLRVRREEIIEADKKDLAYGGEVALNSGLIDRLRLSENRIQGVVDGLRVITGLGDPIGSVDKMVENENSLRVGKMRVPIGVITIIYEIRPNVTVDCTALTSKSGNALLLRGGRETIHSNRELVEALRKTLEDKNLDPNFVQFVDDPTQESSKTLMEAMGYMDLLIPRGSASLIRACIDQAKVPVLQTGKENCHIYVNETTGLGMTLNVVENAKTQRIGVCNVIEGLLVHKKIEADLLRAFKKIQEKRRIRVHRGQGTCQLLDAEEATGEDWSREYLAMECSCKFVDSANQAIDHINKYLTGHSEVVITNSYESSQGFLQKVDSACVYVDAPSHFTDGGQFGMGAEMGISTQKVHARGPVGLEELAFYKHTIYGNGQVRE